jgi:hypothetical protein
LTSYARRFMPAPLVLGALIALAGCASAPHAIDEAAPVPAKCPAEVPATTTCLGGKDSKGAYYLIAKPADWNGHLVLHAHGGPVLGAPGMARAEEDLTRWAIMVKAGYAWAGSTFRQGGVEVRAAAEDTERVRRIFLAHVGKPRRTILHGQSWGGGVAALAAEMYTEQTEGTRPYDAVLLTSGLLAGGTRSYDFRTDMRAVYQYLCNNHPRPGEPAYPLNIGLPVGNPMTSADLRARINECLALDKPAAQRTPEQQAKVQTLEKVIRVPATSFVSHLGWGTFHYRDIASKRTGGASPFGNMGVRYTGSPDDEALNRGVQRLQADPAAYRKFAADTDPSGRIPVPVLTAHWIGDPTVFVEVHNHFKGLMDKAGNGDRLVQTFTTKGTHSYISDPTYPTLMAALLQWIDAGVKPTAAGIAAACQGFEAKFGSGCSFDAGYTPQPLETRIPPRQRP